MLHAGLERLNASIPYYPGVFIRSIGEHREYKFLAVVRIAVVDMRRRQTPSGYSVLVVDS